MRRKPKNVILQRIDEQDENEENAPKKKHRILKKDPGPTKMPRLAHFQPELTAARNLNAQETSDWLRDDARYRGRNFRRNATSRPI